MLAVKKLCDVQRAQSGPGTLRVRGPRALQLVAMEPPDSGGGPASPHTPKMQTFQDSGLGAELQAAMSNHWEDSLAVRKAVGVSRSQESTAARSRGSGRSQDPTVPNAAHSCSRESLDPSAALPDAYEQRPQAQLKQVPLGTATVFKYPPVPAKPRPAGSSGATPTGSPAWKGLGPLRSEPGQSRTRYALSDGEPEEDEEEPAGPPAHLSSYATLTRKPGRSQLTRLSSSPEKHVGRSQSFAVRARKKGPPPPPPKRLSSVSSSTSGESSDSSADVPPGGAAGSSASVRGTEPDWERQARSGRRPPPAPGAAPGPEAQEGGGCRRRVQSDSRDQGVRSDCEEEEPAVPGREGSSPHSSSECIPFAEEGNLTIKQRPKAAGPPRAEAVLEPPEKPPAKNVEVPEFHLKESDTVKRRHKLRDKEPEGGEVAPTEGGGGWASAQSQEEGRLRKSAASLESPAAGPPIKPPLSSKPPVIAPKPVRHSLVAAHGKMCVAPEPRGTPGRCLTTTAFHAFSAGGLSCPSVAISGGQTVAFTAPSSPVHGPPAPGPGSVSAPQSPCLASARSHLMAQGLGPEVVQQRLDHTSSSLAAALQDVERELSQEDSRSRWA